MYMVVFFSLDFLWSGDLFPGCGLRLVFLLDVYPALALVVAFASVLLLSLFP